MTNSEENRNHYDFQNPPAADGNDAQTFSGQIPNGVSYAPPESASPAAPKKSSAAKVIAACILAAVAVVCVVLAVLSSDRAKAFWYEQHGGRIEYPVVLVHGLGGWGEDASVADVQYWGATTGSLPKYLRDQGYTVCVPTVGPYSSTWDRTCELYAQLTGTTVDYGEAHSKAHGHARFGRTYDTPLVQDWGGKVNGGQRVKINLVGHSFGGATVRLLASLLAYGDASEQKATGRETSALFTGGKSDWIFSVTTLCAPHNGSQLTCIVNEIGSLAGVDNMTDLLVDLLFKIVKQYGGINGMPDLMLDQFGVQTASDQSEDVRRALEQIQSAGNDHAYYDLSPDGAAQLNARIRTVDSVYYFSYAYNTTKPGTLLKGMVPETNTLPLLYPLALAMGSYTGTTPGGIVIDESWQENDGLVSVVSAQYPTGDAHMDFTDKVSALRPGRWIVMPTTAGDHGTPVGLNASTQTTHQLYTDLLNRLDALR